MRQFIAFPKHHRKHPDLHFMFPTPQPRNIPRLAGGLGASERSNFLQCRAVR